MKKFYEKLPDTPGVYLMKNKAGELLYVGKAGNLRRRVSSYFLRPHDARIQKLVSEIAKIDHKKTDTAIEALMLEAELIKKYRPPFNIREKDDKSFLYVEITEEVFPRVLLVRGKNERDGERYGPFTSASSIRLALKILRRIFPFSAHQWNPVAYRDSNARLRAKPCFDYSIGLCPGTCIGAISEEEYAHTLKNLRYFLEGKKKMVIKTLQKDMDRASKALEFERAEMIKRKLFSLQHIQDVALIKENETRDEEEQQGIRIEGYDISNISGTSAVGSMVVFENNKPSKSEYRKFKIRGVQYANDVAMLKEVLRRRFSHIGDARWPMPQLLLIDGGKPQVNATRQVLRELKISLPVVGLAKGPDRKNNEVIGVIPKFTALAVLIRVRDEAHRFAVAYHKKVRSRNFFEK
jgi:excinuclease ABC subunit C